ncbi:MAG: DciA family protein [Wenzhouxiangella sp.]|jgi:hypothetical protein|nr:DciA family protein [Wenzhouxiangella sp.]
MSQGNERRAAEVAGRDRQLAALMRTAGIFERLDQKLKPLLPEGERAHIRLACVENDTLVFAADSPAWATRARLAAPRLLAAAAELWPTTLRRTRVIVVPPIG